MTSEKLFHQPESNALESKRHLSSLLPVLKTLVAFANREENYKIARKIFEGREQA